MFTISVCMIVRDEEDVIANCLECVKEFADEIIVVDTGSKDNTINIVKKYTDKVFDFEWVDDFAKARNYSFSFAKCDYIMWLDADDIILKDDINKIKKLKQTECDIDIFMFNYVYSYEKDFVPNFCYFRERLVKREKNFKWQSPIHESISLVGKIEKVDIKIYHNKLKENPPERNLKIFRKMQQENYEFDTRQMFYFARELFYNNYIDEAIEKFINVLNRKDIWIENKLETYLNLSKCYRIKGDNINALKTLFDSFIFAEVRAEILCEIASIYKTENKVKDAIFWYENALKQKPNLTSGGFVNLECYEFIPYVELSCLYFNSDFVIAKDYHEKAKELKPNHQIILNNDKFFNKK